MAPKAQKSFPRTAACLPEIFDFMDTFFADAEVAEPARMPAQFAVEELFTNLVKYSRGGSQDISIELSREDGRLIVSLTDFGVEPFDIRTLPDAKVDLELKDRKPGGLGIHLVRRMVDHIDYQYADGRSTTTFVKSLE
jgi:anti-sigma regulatory factor (Ser/Thr protein kinase)